MGSRFNPVRLLVLLAVVLFFGWMASRIYYRTISDEARYGGVDIQGPRGAALKPAAEEVWPNPAVPPESSPWDEDLFRRLTQKAWTTGTDLYGKIDYRFAFLPDGSFLKTQCPDKLTNEGCTTIETLQWNFRAFDADSGILVLSNQTVNAFHFAGDSIGFDFGAAPYGGIDQPAGSLTGRNALPKIPLPENYARLIRNPWRKDPSELNPKAPDIVMFHANMTCQFRYLKTARTEVGHWGLPGQAGGSLMGVSSAVEFKPLPNPNANTPSINSGYTEVKWKPPRVDLWGTYYLPIDPARGAGQFRSSLFERFFEALKPS